MKKNTFFGLLLVFVFSYGCGNTGVPYVPSDTQECLAVSFTDSALEAEIRGIISKPSGDICRSDLFAITEIDASHLDIISLAGLEYCVNIERLNLSANSITDISALAGLSKITVLDLRFNSFTDITHLSGLSNIEELYLGYNALQSLTPLSGLTKLKVINLQFCGISDISAIAGLTMTETIYLNDNSITNISAFSGLLNIKTAYLSMNNIHDISALVTNASSGGIGTGTAVYLGGNPLSTAQDDIDELKDTYGVSVYQ